MTSERSGAVRVCIFGAIRVERSDVAMHIGSAAQRRILTRLALSPGQVVSQDALIDVLWPDDPPRVKDGRPKRSASTTGSASG